MSKSFQNLDYQPGETEMNYKKAFSALQKKLNPNKP